MVNPVWGQLNKDFDNPQKIEQRIAEMIEAHESDPEAHLGVGESLETHRANEVIDHLAFSVLDDKLALDENKIEVLFNSLSGITKTGGVEQDGINTIFLYSQNSSSPQNLFASVGEMTKMSELSFSRFPRFMTSLMVTQTTQQTGYILAGETDEGNGFGFKIENGELLGLFFNKNNQEQKIKLLDLVAWTNYKVEARADYTNGKIDFFVDNVLKNSLSGLDFNFNMTMKPSVPWVDFRSTGSGGRYLYLRSVYWSALI